MKNILKIMLILLLSTPAFSEQVFNYQTYDIKSGDVANAFSFSVGDLKNGKRKIDYYIKGNDDTLGQGRDEYVVNEHYSTQVWTVNDPGQDTSYTGKRIASDLYVKGRFKGEKVDRILKIDSKPFHYNPKIGLQGFVRSNARLLKFWTLRNDTLDIHLMKARKKGVEKILLQGKEVDAVRVDWTVSGMGSMFFKRTYWFRDSDGVYIKQKVSGRKVRELIFER